MSLYWLFLFCTVAYLIGNLNPALYISHKRKFDITKQGSGNPGSMNILRQFGVKWGALCLVLDALKSAIPAMIAFFFYGGAIYLSDNTSPTYSYIALYAVGLAVVLGHCFPIARGFRHGGKGFASMIGVFMVAHPFISLGAVVVMVAYIAIFEYGAMGSFIYITFMVAYAALQSFNEYNIAVHILLLAFYFLMWFTHRTNITRLIIGKENSVMLFKSIHRKRQKKRHERWLQSIKEEKL